MEDREYYEFILMRDGTEIRYRLTSVHQTWPDLLAEFRSFLRGCGFFMPEGEIDIVEIEEDTNELPSVQEED